MTLPLSKHLLAIATASALALSMATPALAHCDAMDGPVITEAQRALDSGDILPLLKWVPAADETSLQAAFDKTLAVRQLGDDARQIADQQLFATLVEMHRASEGAPFTGIKSAGEIDPAVSAADAALESGNIDELIDRISSKFERQARAHFEAALATRQTADDSIAAGREFVADYVQYVHYLEEAHNAIAGSMHSH